MRENLGVELALDVLLVTSFTCVGLLALWATTSPQHWFVRFAVFFGMISPLLFVPAYEPFVAFCVQFLVILAVAPFSRLMRAQLKQFPDQSWFRTLWYSHLPAFRISMASMLLLTAPIAAGVLIAVHLPALNLDAWNSVVLAGITAGLATLIAAWMFLAQRKIIVWPVAIVCTLLIAALPAWIDWSIPSVTDWCGWPPSKTYGAIIAVPDIRPVCDWFLIAPAVTILLALLLFAWRAAFAIPATDPISAPRRRRLLRAGQCGFSLLVLIVAAFPLAIVARLLDPLPIPQVTLPIPNGYDDFVAAGKMINSPILDTSREPQSTDELAAEIAKFAAVFDRIRLGLSHRCMVPSWPNNGDPEKLFSMSLTEIQAIRGAARAMCREAELAQQQSRYRDAAQSSVDCLRLSRAMSRGGLLVHNLVAMAIEGIGQFNLYPSIDHLDAPTCRQLIAELRDIESSREPTDAIWRRERIYSENAYGWHGFLITLLEDVSHTYGQTFQLTYTTLAQKQAISRMLILALAIQCYELEHGTPPSTLDQLVPDFLDEIPVDPFDPNGKPLRFINRSDGYVLYSVGLNGIDDGGIVSKDEANPMLPQGGDLFLAAYFAAQQEDKNTSQANNSDDDTPNTANFDGDAPDEP